MRIKFFALMFFLYYANVFAIDLSQGRQGIIVFSNNEKMEGKILVTDEKSENSFVSITR